MDIDKLKQFLIKANRNGYGNESITPVIENDGSKTIVFEDGDYKFHDNYFGGEPFGGREVISYCNKVVWIMVYYGSIIDIDQEKEIVSCLREALMSFDDELPYRGPVKYKSDDLIYMNKVDGEFDEFHGEETIYKGKKEVYKARYQGGIVDIN